MAPRVQIQIVAVGRLRAPHDAAAAEYEGRIAKHVGFRLDEVSVAPTSTGDATAQRTEADQLRTKLVDGARIVAVDPTGRVPKSSPAFGSWLQRQIETGRPVSFLIGGPLGLDRALVSDADETLSLGPLTLPHQLARVVLAEQIYRALATAAGHPYAR
ncbi:MAG: 23S rRNA (pseudouridine(1915)-N(3))-methyltransferase RlmH [Thermoleophilia bacterium]|nr:23S rRNA (pseudouridine(1915)-N(3))-methyltransferase RlmH [Thermoleophilia bacterium]MDH3725142.1 23S rRNA (pseudouridine(1915)-N(3))-methyltransferase RlmH [Thermoleophilia bacterium]